MALFKDPAEVLEIAILIERKAVDFYRLLSEKAENPSARDVFSYLASEEEKHIGVFRELLDSSVKYIPRYSYPGEYGTFLDEYASLALDSLKESEKVLRCNDTMVAIAFGIQVELESILFYSELCNSFSEQDSEVVKEILVEEKKHLLELKAIKKKLMQYQ